MLNDLEGEWTFSNLDIEWAHDSFLTREEAIVEAKKHCNVGCYIGQLDHHMGEIKYIIVNQELVMF